MNAACKEMFPRAILGTRAIGSSARLSAWASNLLWQRDVPVFVGWFADRTWENNSKWYSKTPKLFTDTVTFFSYLVHSLFVKSAT